MFLRDVSVKENHRLIRIFSNFVTEKDHFASMLARGGKVDIIVPFLKYIFLRTAQPKVRKNP